MNQPRSGRLAAGRIDGQRLRFVISAGRTGTVFLARKLRERSGIVDALHEPWPGRWELVLANFRNQHGFGDRLLQKLFAASRARRLNRLPAGSLSIEINPHLCPLTDVVAQNVAPLYVVHLVREPMSWARSLLSFGAAGWRRPLIGFVPYSAPYPSPRPAGWLELGPMERALWRWRYCNEQIGALEAASVRYRVIRYEDLFSADTVIRGRAFRDVLHGTGLEQVVDDDRLDISQRMNASNGAPEGSLPVAGGRVQEICGALLTRYGYGPR
jgi:hypothetical protein